MAYPPVTEIPLSKTKVTLLLLASVLFVVFGFWFVLMPPVMALPRLVLQITGGAAVLFFALTGLVAVRKLMDNTPGLIIADDGITDNSSGISAGFIPWADVTDVSVIEIANQKMAMIHVKNPQKYINRQATAIQKKIAQANFNHYGSPISISANTLTCPFEQMYNLLKTNLQNRL